MKYSIFYRSYWQDFKWLKYSLESVKKYLNDYSEIVIVVPPHDYDILKEQMKDWDLPKGIVVYRDPNEFKGDGYLGQQLCKLHAFDFANYPYILFVDSDAIFTKSTDINHFIRNDKPCVIKTPYITLVGDVLVWKGITEKVVGFPVQYEYMRRLPILYRRDTLRNLLRYFMETHGMTIEDYMKLLTDRSFSEFNMMGAYTEKYEAGKYYFLNTEKEKLNDSVLKQYWSWGGLTPEIQTEIEKILS